MPYMQTLAMQPVATLIDEIEHRPDDHGNSQRTEGDITHTNLLKVRSDQAHIDQGCAFPCTATGKSLRTVHLSIRAIESDFHLAKGGSTDSDQQNNQKQSN